MKKLILFILVLFMVPMVAFGVDMTVKWTNPTTNSDGTALTDLAGVKLFCGDTAGNYPNLIFDEPTTEPGVQMTKVITGISGVEGNAYHCVAVAYDSSGNDSVYSAEVIYQFPLVAPSPPSSIVITIQ